MGRAAKGLRRVTISVVAGLLATCVGCTGSAASNARDDTAGGNGKNQDTPSAPPGKYSTLPDPCDEVPREVLAKLLPGAGAASPTVDDTQEEDDEDHHEEESAEESDGSDGKATLTYDTDRRVGCEWSGSGDSLNRRLRVDFWRVISYDPSVSDEEQAHKEYLRAIGDGEVARGGETPSPKASGGSPAEDGPGAPSAGSSSSPRVIAGIGDEALLGAESRATAAEPHHEISIVFRKENVIVRVTLREWPLETGRASSRPSILINTRLLAQDLADTLSED